jgi:excisionase family DNA binding protein
MRDEALLTTGEIAAHCRVSYEAVSKWIKSGKLKAYTTPGRHRRVRRADFEEFLREYNLPPLAGAPRRRKVLIVDDDPAILSVLSAFFAKGGQYEVATAADGFEAGTQIAGNCPELVILDLMMPNIDGFKVCEGIRSNPKTRRIIVVVLTGYATPENVRKALECGADCCLEKPVVLGELAQKLDELWAGAGAGRRRAHA